MNNKALILFLLILNSSCVKDEAIVIKNTLDLNIGSYVDIRDSNIYKTVEINEKVWFSENLKYKVDDGEYLIPENNLEKNDSSYAEYGFYYTNKTALRNSHLGIYSIYDRNEIQEAIALRLATRLDPVEFQQGICPDGWHVPSGTEWEELIAFFGGKENAFKHLINNEKAYWTSSNEYTNLSNMDILPGGYFYDLTTTDTIGETIGEDAYFLTSSKRYVPCTGCGSQIYMDKTLMMLRDEITELGSEYTSRKVFFNLRCLKDY